jgi:hypothetical protein
VGFRRQRLADRVADTPVSFSRDGGEKTRLCRLRKTRQKNLTAYLAYDLSRFPAKFPIPLIYGKNIVAMKVGGVSFTELTQEPQMQMLRFGRKISLPSTIAIKHQFKKLLAQCEAEKAGAEGGVNVFRAQRHPAVTSVTSIATINASASDRIRTP